MSPGAPPSGARPQALLAADPSPLARYVTFDSVVALIRDRRDLRLLMEVETHLRLVRYSPGRIEFEPTAGAPADLAARLAGRLQGWTGTRWAVTVTGGGGATLAETRAAEEAARLAQARENPVVQAILAAFPEARITAVRDPDATAPSPAEEALAAVEDEVDDEVDNDWDPFEDN